MDPARQSESRSYQLLTTLIVCPVFAGVFTLLRIYTRVVLVKKYFWEDLVIGMAWICSVVMTVANGYAIVYGSGRHVETISAADMVEFLKVGVAIAQLYSLNHFLLKLSILLQYVRISVLPLERRICRGAIVVLSVGYLAFIVLRMVRCVPFEAQWNKGIPGARCFFNATWFMFASQAWNMVMDIVIVVLPLFILRHSSAPLAQRVLLGIVLAFGASAAIISAIRLHTLHPSTTSSDPSWDKVPSAIYALIEVNVGISCASMVALRPLYRRVRAIFPRETHVSHGTLMTLPEELRPQRRSDESEFGDHGIPTRVDGDNTRKGTAGFGLGKQYSDGSIGGTTRSSEV